MNDTTEQTPIFDFGDYYPGSIEIGTKKLPVLVKNLTVDELDTFRKGWATFIEPRGSEPAQTLDRAAHERETQAFCEQVIRDYIALKTGLVKYRGEWVTTGDGLLRAFHARQQVLGPLVGEVMVQNSLVEVTRKNLKSPPASAGGSTASTPTSGDSPTGGRPAPTADNAGHAVSAAPAAATDEPSAAPSGPENGPDRIH